MDEALTTLEAGVELGICQRRVVGLILSGRLKARRFGTKWLIKRADLDTVRYRPLGRPKRLNVVQDATSP